MPESERQKRIRKMRHRALTKGQRICSIYIKTKLSSAGASYDIFTPQALRAIASYSSGNPRVISRVCDLALMIANKIDKSNIDEEVANLAINEVNM